MSSRSRRMRDAGRSARQRYQEAKARRNRLRRSPAMRALYAAGLAGLTIVIARGALQQEWLSSILLAVGVVVVYAAFLRWPQQSLTIGVVVGWVLVCPAIAWLVVAVTPELATDITARIAALALYGALIGFLSIRYRNGRLPWVTCLAALLAMTAMATAFYHLDWPGGLWVGYAVGLLVVGLRAGAWDYLLDMWDWAVDRPKKKDGDDPVRTDPATQWAKDAEAERATAKLLAGLPNDYVILHDRRMPGVDEPDTTIDHLVVGPSGVFVIDSAAYAGRVRPRSNGRLWHDKSPLDDDLLSIFWKAQVVATRTGLPARALVAVHGATMAQHRIQVGLFSHQGPDDQARTGDVVVIDADQAGPTLLGEILTPAGESAGRAEVHRNARRVRRGFPPAASPAPAPEPDERAKTEELWPIEVDLVSVDADAVGPADADSDDPDGSDSRNAGEPSDGDVADDSAGPGALRGSDAMVHAEVNSGGEATYAPIPAGEDLPAHQEYVWGQPDKDDELAKDHTWDLEHCTLKPGDRVHSIRPDEMLTNWVVISAPYLHEAGEGGTPVVDIADPEEIEAAKAEDRPPQYLAEPIWSLIEA